MVFRTLSLRRQGGARRSVPGKPCSAIMDLSFMPDTIQRHILAMCTEEGNGTQTQGHTPCSSLPTDALHGQLPTAPPLGADQHASPPSSRSLCDQACGSARNGGGKHASAETRETSPTLPDLRRSGLAVLDAFIPHSGVEVRHGLKEMQAPPVLAGGHARVMREWIRTADHS
uniref:Uncharacterized protein n=1 Tax=Chlamydomonas euryale TaxID=1486919 RepID=A0A7R9YU20_9CHLO|mmetsp:Transcript_23978/g.71162  ORF Transcript_23978/g.71162 Transcript_23978/m.71162 type:complete len:172 (+) Transcript_23978:3-518(+)